MFVRIEHGAVSEFLNKPDSYQQTETMAEKNIVPNLETKATDGNPVFTPRQWLERFKQFTKREHKIDITPLLKGEDITDSGYGAKEQAPEALFQITRAEYKTDPDNKKIKI